MISNRFKEAILYLCLKSEQDINFGAIKLNKLLFFADLEAYVERGETITRQQYQKLPQGPAPRAIVPVLNQMQEDGEIVVRERTVWHYTQKKTFALREPDLGAFNEVEIGILDRTVERFAHMNATEMSDASHRFIGWKVAAIGETIPLSTAFIDIRPLANQEKDHALSLEEHLPNYAADDA